MGAPAAVAPPAAAVRAVSVAADVGLARRRHDAGAARAGVVVMAPFVVGFAPFALVIGSAVARHGDRLAGWSGSWLVYGGSAHQATLRALDGSGLLVAVLTGALVNARLLIYSASLATRWSDQPTWFRLVAAPLIIDPTWAVASGRDPAASRRAERRFFLAAGVTLGVGWSAMIGVGAVLGARLDGGHLAVAVPLCLAALVGPHLRASDTRVVCVVAGAVAAVFAHLPAGTALLVAVAAGCVAGAVADRGGRP
jgi:predicted branched-subunit amino acid permease